MIATILTDNLLLVKQNISSVKGKEKLGLSCAKLSLAKAKLTTKIMSA